MTFLTRTALAVGALAALTTGGLIGTALASGSEGFSQAPTGDTQKYNAGKGVYADKLSCSGCPLAGKQLTSELAREVLGGKPQIALSPEEQSALTVYLKRRFRI